MPPAHFNGGFKAGAFDVFKSAGPVRLCASETDAVVFVESNKEVNSSFVVSAHLNDANSSLHARPDFVVARYRASFADDRHFVS